MSKLAFRKTGNERLAVASGQKCGPLVRGKIVLEPVGTGFRLRENDANANPHKLHKSPLLLKSRQGRLRVAQDASPGFEPKTRGVVP